MARPLRIEFPGAHYHVMSRGIERRAIVRDDADRRKWIDWLRRTVQTYGWRLHAFVLMNNHHHLFVETPEPNLSAGMQFFNGSYTSYFNRRHRRPGHLFQGRFKAQLVEQQGYYLEVSRYIHLNPRRAKVVERPQAYPFSSYPGYHWAARALPWVTYASVLGEFGREASKARAAYRRFVAAGVKQPPPNPFSEAAQGLLLGSDAFLSRVRRLLDERPEEKALPQLMRLRARPSLAEIKHAVAEEFGVLPGRWERGRRCDDASRAVAAYLGRCHFGYPAGEVARQMGYASASGVGQAVKRVEAGNPQLNKSVQRIQQKLTNG
jgi:REP element-mobilizing transposase RayT